MKTLNQIWILLVGIMITFSSCEVVQGIFKAGFWSAIILIVVVVALILWLVGRGRR